MIRFRQINDANSCYHYFEKSDSGLSPDDLRMEVGGKGAKQLGLDKHPDFEQFKRLLEGNHPKSGDQLTAQLQTGRIAGWDITASIPKGVTVAIEWGDQRVQDALWAAARETMDDLEQRITTRVRGGRDGEAVTGNMIWYGFEHPETRPARENNLPDPDRHIHFVVPNVTWTGDQWQAIRFRPIMEDRKWFDRRFDSRLASKLTDLGYEIETKYKSDNGERRYFSWDIKDIPESVTAKFSRRAQEVEALAEELGVRSAQGKDKLGATSRQFKRKDLTLEDYREYWHSRISPEEAQAIEEVIEAARQGENPNPERLAGRAMDYAINHHFERQAVVPLKELEITAMERSMGAAYPQEIEAAGKHLLVKNGEATTKEVLEQEGRIIAFAREGRGTMRPLGTRAIGMPGNPENDSERAGSDPELYPRLGNLATLSPEQQAVSRHVLESRDRVVMIEGDAGVGKTHTMKATIDQIDRPVVVLAPSVDASRNVLRKDFPDADTVASFLGNRDFQARAKGGVIWIDEAGQLSMNQLDHVFGVAKHLDARVVLQGDRKQHSSIERGHILNVLQEHAGLPVARLAEIRRQRGDYKHAIAAMANGDILKGYDILDGLGWVKETHDNRPLIEDYLSSLDAGKSVLVVAPTHAQGDAITAEVRAELKERGVLGDEERVFETLTPVHWSLAQKGDRDSYSGTEVIQFHRNSGTHRAGDRLEISRVPGERLRPEHFSVYTPTRTHIAAGDTIRLTGNGWDKTHKHRLNNGSVYTVARFTKPSKDHAGGDIELSNGWVISKDFGHLTHGYVQTSHASQGKTIDRVLIAMDGTAAVNAQQFYVSASRGRERATIYHNMEPDDLRDAIQRTLPAKSATELFGQPRQQTWHERAMAYMSSIRKSYEVLRERVSQFINDRTQQVDYGLERY